MPQGLAGSMGHRDLRAQCHSCSCPCAAGIAGEQTTKSVWRGTLKEDKAAEVLTCETQHEDTGAKGPSTHHRHVWHLHNTVECWKVQQIHLEALAALLAA